MIRKYPYLMVCIAVSLLFSFLSRFVLLCRHPLSWENIADWLGSVFLYGIGLGVGLLAFLWIKKGKAAVMGGRSEGIFRHPSGLFRMTFQVLGP